MFDEHVADANVKSNVEICVTSKHFLISSVPCPCLNTMCNLFFNLFNPMTFSFVISLM
jgi:hypothetical protein